MYSLLWQNFCLALPAILLVLSFSPTSVTTAQSTQCHSCIRKAIPTVGDCSTLNSSQLATLDMVIHGNRVYSTPSLFRSSDPIGFQCLVSLMWDVVHYKANLWSQCLDPKSGCPWSEMMHYMEMIPKLASVYGAQNPPAQILIDPPA